MKDRVPSFDSHCSVSSAPRGERDQSAASQLPFIDSSYFCLPRSPLPLSCLVIDEEAGIRYWDKSGVGLDSGVHCDETFGTASEIKVDDQFIFSLQRMCN